MDPDDSMPLLAMLILILLATVFFSLAIWVWSR